MNTIHYAIGGIAFLLISGCATVSENPQQGVLGVWELTKALDLRPQDAGFVENTKLVFLPEGKLYKMGPTQDEFAERKLYGYRIDGGTLIRTSPGREDIRTPFSFRGNALVIVETDGSRVHFKKRSADHSVIPVWESKMVPFTVNYNQQKPPVDYPKNKREALESLESISLATIQAMTSGHVGGFEDDDGNVIVFLDRDIDGSPTSSTCRVTYDGMTKEDALRILKAKEDELQER